MDTLVHNMLDAGTQYSLREWSRLAEAAVVEMQLSRWYMTAVMFKRLRTFLYLNPDNMYNTCWWNVCKGRPRLVSKCRTLVALILGEHNLGCGKGRFVHHSKMCQLCSGYVYESLHHCLIDCTGLSDCRRTLMDTLIDTMPPAMTGSLWALSSERQTLFLLGEMGRTFVKEWFPVHRAIIELVHGLYNARMKLMDN